MRMGVFRVVTRRLLRAGSLLLRPRLIDVDEPNILFTSAEKTAILNFISHGGGLFMIPDHTVSEVIMTGMIRRLSGMI